MNNQQISEQDINHKMDIAIKWDEENQFFLIRFLKNEHPIFTVQLLPENFEKLANNMLRNVKDFNLMQIKMYKERINAEKQSNPEAGLPVPDLCCADTTCETQPEQSPCNNG